MRHWRLVHDGYHLGGTSNQRRRVPSPSLNFRPLPSAHPVIGNKTAQQFLSSCPQGIPNAALCPLGGACHACPARAQAKLEVSRPNDPYEREADRVADRVTAMPEPKAQKSCPSCEDETIQHKPLAGRTTPLVQRQEENPEEGEEPMRAKRENNAPPRLTPGLNAQIRPLRAGGAPLPAATRTFFERRFGNDFGDVRVHAGPQAARAAKAVRAQAFTLGRDVVFGENRYDPNSPPGRKLLAHELAHTVQQRGSSILHRKVVVQDPMGKPPKAPAGETNENIIRDYVTTLCPGFTVFSGELLPIHYTFCPVGAASSGMSKSCECLCTMHNHTDSAGASVTWNVVVDDLQWPSTDETTHTISIQSPYSGLEFGAWGAGNPSHRVHADLWLVFAHEICGHGYLYAQGKHPRDMTVIHGGSPEHDPSVNIQNEIATEHRLPQSEMRGTYKDPHHGESYTKITVQNYPFGKFRVSDLPADERGKLDTAATFMRKMGVKADVIGHADKPTASAGGNILTSRYRAWGVQQALVSRGVWPNRFLYADGVGDSECRLPGKQPSCRKVEVFMFGQSGASITHPYP
jgi:outer membrane protein OmpA-like peptidoglycan-associated protein